MLATTLFSNMPVYAYNSETPIVNNIIINNNKCNCNADDKEFKLNHIVVNTEEELKRALVNASGDETIVINRDMNISDDLIINESIKLNLNGHTIKFNGGGSVLVGSVKPKVITETVYKPGYFTTKTVYEQVCVPAHYETKIDCEKVWEPGHYKTEVVNEKVWVPGHYETINSQRKKGHYESRNGQCVWVPEEPTCCCELNKKWVEGYYKTEPKEKQVWVEGCYKTVKKEKQVWVPSELKTEPREKQVWVEGHYVTAEKTVYIGKDDIIVYIENGKIIGSDGANGVAERYQKDGSEGNRALIMRSGTLNLRNMIFYGGNGGNGKDGNWSIGRSGGNGASGVCAVWVKSGKRFVADNCAFYGGHGGLGGKKDNTGWTSIFCSSGLDGTDACGLWYDITDVQLISCHNENEKGHR